jgi:uncharacterized lipoprotein YmbA
MTRALAALAAMFLLAACGSTPKESYYTLSASPAPVPASGASAVSVTIGPVAVPEAVDRSPMVVRTGPTEVSIDDLHRWVEPLKSAIPRALAELLMRDLGTPNVLAGRSALGTKADYRVAVDVQRFDSSFSEGATLDAAWTVTPGQGPARGGRTFAQEAAPSRDHAGIAAAHRKALEKLAADIAAAIRAKP